MLRLCAALILLACVGPAAAEIRVDVSRYQNGKLIIRGETAPGRTVVLDDKFATRSDRQGHFSFAVDELPFTCMSDIRSGDDIYSAVIAGCLNPSVVEHLRPLPPAASN